MMVEIHIQLRLALKLTYQICVALVGMSGSTIETMEPFPSTKKN